MVDLKKSLLLASALALAFASVSDLAAGLAWLGLILAGVGACWPQRGQRPEAADLGPAWQAARLWWWACVLSWALMMLVTAYWGGPWPERHAQWRLLLGALGLLCLVRYGRWPPPMLRWLGHAVALTQVLALGLLLLLSSDATPTNRIPWMAGVSLLSLALLTWAHIPGLASVWTRRIWWMASLLALGSVLLSGVRGSWLLLILWPITAAALHMQDRQLWRWSARGVLLLSCAVAVLLAVLQPLIPARDHPVIRLVQLFQETGLSNTHQVDGNSSTGARVLLYKAGLHQVLSAPSWLGIGHAEHMRRLKQHLQTHSPEAVQAIGHYHNDALNAWVEFGLLGLLAYLVLPLAMAWMVWRLGRSAPQAACGVAALALMHVGTGLSNANLAHNYYPVMWSLALSLVLLAQRSAGLSRSNSAPS